MKKILLILSGVFVFSSLTAQWTKMDGPYGSWVSSITSVDGSKIYCSASGNNLYSSIDTGKTWQKEFTNLFEGSINIAVAGEGKMLVGKTHTAQTTYACLSLDSGLTYSPFSAPFADSINSYAPLLKIYPSGIYASALTGFYMTTDNGQNWTSLISNLPDSSLISDYVVYGNKIMLVDNDTIYYSENNGPWMQRGLSLQSMYLYYMREINGTVYLTTSNGIYRTYDDGVTWIDISANLGNIALLNFKVMENKIYIFYGDDIIVSDTGNVNWTFTGFTPPGSSQDVVDAFRCGNLLLAATMKGIYRGDTSMVNPGIPSNYGIEIYGPEGFLVDSNIIHVGDNFGYSISIDSGTTWTEKSEPIGAADIKKFGNDIFICKYGETWHSTAGSLTCNYLSAMPSYDMTKTPSGTLFAASLGGGVFISIDNGVTYNPVNNGLPELTMTSIASVGNNVIVGNAYDGLFLSTDSGNTWTQTGAFGYGIYDIVRHKNLLFATAVGLNTLISADSGLTWQECLNSTMGGAENFLVSSGNEVFAVNVMSGAEMSVDDGQSWINLSPYITPGQFGEVAIPFATADRLYYATMVRGIWYIPIPTLTGIPGAREKKFVSLYPNPATNLVLIGLPAESSKATVSITDVTGKLIYTSVATTQKTFLHTDDFTAGVYFVKVQSRDFVETKKLVIEE